MVHNNIVATLFVRLFNWVAEFISAVRRINLLMLWLGHTAAVRTSQSVAARATRLAAMGDRLISYNTHHVHSAIAVVAVACRTAYHLAPLAVM